MDNSLSYGDRERKTKITMLKMMFYGVSRTKKFTASVIWSQKSKIVFD